MLAWGFSCELVLVRLFFATHISERSCFPHTYTLTHTNKSRTVALEWFAIPPCACPRTRRRLNVGNAVRRLRICVYCRIAGAVFNYFSFRASQSAAREFAVCFWRDFMCKNRAHTNGKQSTKTVRMLLLRICASCGLVCMCICTTKATEGDGWPRRIIVQVNANAKSDEGAAYIREHWQSDRYDYKRMPRLY